jgi:hypothetical protein
MQAPAEETAISDERMFGQWLETREHNNLIEYGPIIAHRASLRAIPSLSLALRFMGPEQAREAVFWPVVANLIFRAWRRSPESNFVEAAGFAQVGAHNAAERASSSNVRIVSACRAAAGVAKIMAADFSRQIMEEVVTTVTSAAASLERRRDFWALLQIDVEQLQSGLTPLEVMGKPLWQAETPMDIGIDISQLRRIPGPESADWAWLIDWYEARVEGKSGSWGLSASKSAEIERRIASGGLEPGFWRRTPDEITTDIAGWLREAGWGRTKESIERVSESSSSAPRKTAAKKQAIKKPVPKKRIKSKTGDEPITISIKPDAGSAKPETLAQTEDSQIASKRADLEPLADTVDGSVDHLGRANIAYALAGRINEVWDQMNKPGGKAAGPAPGFVIHIDAPWGGGKSTFAEHIAQILNPYSIKGPLPTWLKALPIGKDGTWPERFRRPWHIVRFNAWQHQHVTPPWWVFYETIRETVTTVTGAEANHREAAFPMPLADFGYRSPAIRKWKAFELQVREYVWRFATPTILLNTAFLVFTVTLLSLLTYFGLISFDIEKGASVAKAAKDSAAGGEQGGLGFVPSLLVALFGGGAALWKLAGAFSASLVPGTPNAANNYSLGSGDPLKRMKRHFVSLMETVHRPVLVIVDDLDRCEPAFVVELVRGMQTILASPRVVYLLLGDRDWIEQSFTEVHKAMKGVEVGPEHRFGGRFVEKAIQFSMVLPDVSEQGRQDYVRQLLTSSGRQAVAEPVTAPPSVLDSAVVPENQRKIVEDLKADAKAVLETDDYEQRERLAMDLADKFDRVQVDLPRQAFDEEMAQKLFFRAATDSTAERATSHMIEGMASILPANPRQIKRIVNTLSLLGQVLRIKDPAKRPGSADWQVLARWVVLMVEWPKSWFTLTRHPGLADVGLAIAQGKSEDEIAAIETAMKPLGLLPASGGRPLAKLIAANATVMRVLDFVESDWVKRPITASEITWLREVMPAASGQLLQPPQQEKPASSDPAAAAGKAV